MSRILVYNVPLRGHTTPLFPVIKELAGRGHQIVYCLTPKYRAAIEATGAEFRAYPSELVGDQYFEERRLDTGNPISAAASLISTAESLLPELLPFVNDFQPDVIIHDAMCLWGGLLSQINQVPAVSSMTMFMLNNRLFARSSALLKVMWMILSQLPEIHRYRLAEGRLRRKYGVRLPYRLEEVLNAPGRDLTLTYSSPLLLPSGGSRNNTFVNVGPTVGATAEWGDFPVDQLTDKPLIYASLGTLTNRNARFYENCLKAFAGSDHQLVLSLGAKNGTELFSQEQPGVIIREFVPQLKVLQQTAVFISHAGMNSVHESLYYGVPLVMAPQQVEQQVVASQVVQAGAGVCLSATPSPESLRTAVERVLHEPSFAKSAMQVRDSLRASGGARGASEAIERLMDSAGRAVGGKRLDRVAP